MRTWKLIALVLALVLVSAACGDDDDSDGTTTTAAADETTTTAAAATTTAAADETTTTAAATTTQGSDSASYPWVSLGANADQVPEVFDDLEYGAHQLQAPCADCGQPITPSLPKGTQATELDACGGGPVLYWQNELIVQSEDPEGEFSDIFVEDITPQLVLSDEEGDVYPPTEPQDDGSHLFKLITIDVSVDDALGEHPGVSPNYEYVAAPPWKFGPGDQKVLVTSDADMPNELFSGGSVTVVDTFGAKEDQALDGHGEFIASLIEALTGKSPEEVPLDFVDKSARFGPKWPRNDSMAVAAALRKAGTLSPEVVNLSFGTYLCTDEQLVSGELAALQDEKTVVAAAGNDGFAEDGPAFFPASGAIGVGAAGRTGDPDDGWRVADFSNRSAVVEWAPGVAVVSEIGGDLYQWSGTSFAAPMIAACLAAGDTCE